MSAEVLSTGKNVATIQFSGRVKYSEFAAAQRQIAAWIAEHGRVRLLVLLTNFSGTEKGGNWGDLSFQAEHDGAIEKMAIVGPREFEDFALLFAAKGIRPFPIEYFTPKEQLRAEAWLQL